MNRANHVLSPVLSHATQLEIASGRGCYLTGTSGETVLDFSSGIAVASTGHCHPDVVAAIQKQSETLIHACAGVVYYSPNIALAEKLGLLLGPDLSSVFFTQSGTEANEAAIKLALYTSQKPQILAFKGGFHGRTLGSLSVTFSNPKYRSHYESFLGDSAVLPFPYVYRPEAGLDAAAYLQKCTQLAVDYIGQHSAQLAAVIVEPILGEGGYIPAPDSFLIAVATACRQHQVLLICDEIQTGMGRSGYWSYAQKVGITPDILTLAKGLGSGMPIGAAIASPALMARWTTGAHGGTYGGNPVSCAAALATIDVLTPQLPEVRRLGNIARDRLNSALADHPNVGDIRGDGLMIGIELVKDKNSKTPDPERVSAVRATCLKNGLLIVACGEFGQVIRLMPPLIIDEPTLNIGLDQFILALNEHR